MAALRGKVLRTIRQWGGAYRAWGVGIGVCGGFLVVSVYLWFALGGHWGVLMFWTFVTWVALIASAWLAGPLLNGVDPDSDATE